MKKIYIQLIAIILILLFGCENQKRNEKVLDIEKHNELLKRQYENIVRQTDIINKTYSKILQEQDSIPLSLIIFSLNTKEVEKMLHSTSFIPTKIFFHSKYKITSKSKSSFNLFSIDFKIIKIVNKTNSFPLVKLEGYTQEGNNIYLRYKYRGMFVAIYMKKIDNNFKIIESFTYET